MNLTGGKMKKSSYRKVFFTLFIISSFFLFAEGEDKEAVAGKKLPAEESILLDTKKTEEQTSIAALNNTENNSNSAADNRISTPITGLLQLLAALTIVCILAYVVIKFLKKSTRVFGTDDPYLKNVSSINIAQGKSIHVITLGEKAYIIGVSDSSINKIGEVEDKNLVDAMNLEADKKSVTGKKDFSSVFALFWPQKQAEKKASSEDFFAAQHERLNKAADFRNGNNLEGSEPSEE
ncbi:flagellar biosynthetic protein FliO [Treponema pedis]|nr:flagellar biosynthetic protein FliO [Treponema pedis]